MSAPEQQTRQSSDWASILDTAGTSSSGLISSSSHSRSLGGDVRSSSSTSSNMVSGAAGTTRKRTLTHFSTHSSSANANGTSDPQTTAATSSDELASGEPSTKSGKSSSVASSAASMRSAAAATNKILSTKEYYDRCKKVAAARVEDMVRRHYTFRTADAGRVDPMRWKLLKAKHHLACYRRVAKSAPSQVPDVLATGTLTGALDDVLHGVVNLSTEAMQIENAYAAGDMVDTRTLATLVAPTTHAPFTTVSIKWELRNHEELSRHRDYVYLEATGLTTAPDGETVAYHLVHSVALPSAPAFTKDTNIIRGQLSTCYVYRQRAPASQRCVDVFYIGNVNPMGNTRERPALALAVARVLASASSVQCAMMKKLAFSLRTKPPLSTSDSDSDTSVSVPAPPPPTRSRKNTISAFMRSGPTDHHHTASACMVCRRSLRFVVTKGACALCRNVACSRCRVAKKLFRIDHGVFNPVKIDFCTECIVATTALSATFVAARELELANRPDDWDNVRDDSRSDRNDARSFLSSNSNSNSSSRLDKAALSNDSDGSLGDEQRYTMATDYSRSSISSNAYDHRASRIWMPSDRVLRPTADVLAPICAEPEDDSVDYSAAAAQTPMAFFAVEDEACPIVEMPSDDEGDDPSTSASSSSQRVAGGVMSRTNHAVDLVVLYRP